METHLKRSYDPPSPQDGYRVLIDRLWPRGIKKEEAHIDSWMKELAPSHELRKWFAHDPAKWQQFKEKYFQELQNQSEKLEQLKQKCKEGKVTLVYSTKDRKYNNAAALKEFLQQ